MSSFARIQPSPGFVPPARLLREINAIYPFLQKSSPQDYPKDLEGREGSASTRIPRDVDRVEGGGCWLESQYPWSFSVLDRTLVQENFPVQTPDGCRASDLTYDAAQQKVAVQGKNAKTQQWEVVAFDLQPQAQGQTLHRSDHPFASIEWDPQGHLLVADGSLVQRLHQGNLEPVLDCGAPIKDITTLSDGGLCLFVESHSPSGCDVLYQAPGSSALQALPVLPGYSEWLSPNGQHSLVFRPESKRSPLYGRSQQEELGPLLQIEHIPKHLPFGKGVDPQSAHWSPDSRFFAVTSRPNHKALKDVRDTWLWDTQALKSYTLPGVAGLDFTAQGLQLHLPGQANPTLPLDQLEQISQQPWYQQQLSRPIFLQRRGQVQKLARQGQEQPQALDPSGQLKFITPVQGDHLIGIAAQGQRAHIWNLNNGLNYPIDQVNHVYWDPAQQQLGVVSGDPPTLEQLSLEQLADNRWYRQALEPQLPLAAPVERTPEGIKVGGLLFPRRQ